MNVTGSEARQASIARAMRIRELVASRDPKAAAVIDRALEHFQEGRFILTVLGKAKRGKSTLVNALLGRRDDLVAPIDKLPASSVISRFVWAEQPRATVFFRSRDRAAAGAAENIPFERIREFVTEEKNPNNVKQVETVEVAGPFPDFDHDLILVDTPGAGSIHEYHDALLHAFIPQSDVILFLVTARMPIDQDELELLQQVKAADIQKVVFAINKVDRAADGDIEEAVAHNRGLLAEAGISVERLHRISALRAFQADPQDSGLDDLCGELRALLTSHKGQLLEARLRARVSEVIGPVLKGLAIEVDGLGKTAEEIASQRRELVGHREKLSRQCSAAERHFVHRWSRAIDHFAQSISTAPEEVKIKLLEQVRGTAMVGLSRLHRELPSIIGETVDEYLRPHAQRMENGLQEACRELEGGYPALELGIGPVAIGRQHDRSILLGAVGAAATAAAGAGLVAAAQVATAASVAYVTTPSLVGALLTQLIGTSAGFLSTTSVPVAAPLWVALAGPIGWTMAGMGALALPFAWTMSKARQKHQLEQEVAKQVDRLFSFLRDERLPQLRKSAESILEGFRLHAEQELEQAESALNRLVDRAGDVADRESLEALLRELNLLVNEPERPGE